MSQAVLREHRVVVVGAGVGGLVSALLLAQRGLQVTLVEAAAAPGGKMRQVQVDGVAVNLGTLNGAGTVTNPRELDAALEAGAEFIVAPGLTEPLGKAAIAAGVPFLPGIANAGDIMRGLDLGLERFKFFPAMAAGGLPALKALAAPFGNVRFCPTGGISLDNAAEWLAFDPVLCVGGSWVSPKGAPNQPMIEAMAREAFGLR
jgi:2-dehydro-3-deoxyphosphogluconate aldolase/(4S)-4-hydroxy-2-oxoglutarate aldolase